MKITKELLKEKNACNAGYEWFIVNCSDGIELDELCKKLLESEKFDWANWMLRKLFNKKQAVKYAIFAAEQVIDIFEKKYPEDKRPRQAIKAAKKYLKNPCDKTKKAADAAADAAAYAAYEIGRASCRERV